MSILAHIKTITERSHNTLVHDALGASALFVILLVGLYLPVFF